MTTATGNLRGSLPVAMRERFDRAREDFAAICGYLDDNERQLSDESAEMVCEWVETVASKAWRSPLKLYEPEQQEFDDGRDPIPEDHYTLPGQEPEVVFEVDGDEVRMVFKSDKERFFALEKRGREHAQRKNVVYPIGPWSHELCARWAVQEAITRYLEAPSPRQLIAASTPQPADQQEGEHRG